MTVSHLRFIPCVCLCRAHPGCILVSWVHPATFLLVRRAPPEGSREIEATAEWEVRTTGVRVYMNVHMCVQRKQAHGMQIKGLKNVSV